MTADFVKAVRTSEIGLRPILPLAQPIDIGHVGTIDGDGVFHHRGTISSLLGLNSIGPELPVQSKAIALSVTSGSDVRVNFGAGASTDGALAQFGKIKVKASIDFGSSNSFFLALDGLRIRQLAEPQELIAAMLAAYRAKPRRWEKDWVFVDRLGIADHLTVILTREAKTTVLLKGSATAKAAATDVDLATGFSFVASTKGVTQITGQKRSAAFYSAYRVHDGWLSPPRVEQAYLALAFGTELAAYPPGALNLGAVGDLFDEA